jgi:hypothetical protein
MENLSGRKSSWGNRNAMIKPKCMLMEMWTGTADCLSEDYDICNYVWTPLKKNFTRQNVMKHNPVVCQHLYISNMYTTLEKWFT